MASVGVLDKVMAILDAFTDGAARLDPPQVAARVGITSPTAYRLMGAMAEHRLLDSDGRSYRLGSRLLQLGGRASEGVEPRVVAAPHMTALRDATDETVELQVLSGHTRVPVEMVIGRRSVRTMGQIGLPLPLHLGASSRVLVAWRSEEEALELAGRSAQERADAAWDAERYRRRLRQVREQGWEYSAGERDPETSAISAPIRDRSGEVVAALVVSATAGRLADQEHRRLIVERACACARDISRDLGHQGASHPPKESIA